MRSGGERGAGGFARAGIGEWIARLVRARRLQTRAQRRAGRVGFGVARVRRRRRVRDDVYGSVCRRGLFRTRREALGPARTALPVVAVVAEIVALLHQRRRARVAARREEIARARVVGRRRRRRRACRRERDDDGASEERDDERGSHGACQGSECFGSFKNSWSVRLFKNSMTSARSSAVTVSGTMSGSLRGLAVRPPAT